MNLKALLIVILFLNLCYANTQKVTIGTIAWQYKDIISKEKLEEIVFEIEQEFESKLNTNLFDYSENGIPINLIYIPATKLEQNILSKNKIISQLLEEINKNKSYISDGKKQMYSLRNSFKKENTILNNRIKKLNGFIKSIKKQKNISMQEYKQAKQYVKKERDIINSEIKRVKIEHKNVSLSIKDFNKKISSYNNLIQKYNSNIRDLEAMTRGFKKIKGKTFMYKKVITKNIYKDGKTRKQKEEKNYMSKIEIYGFDNLKELKAVIAHEIGHLLGVPHINSKNALMNPIIQKKQLENFSLTYDDVEAFNKVLLEKQNYSLSKAYILQ
ncbi:MAG: matrixin family metalloprotease [Halarcobacter sp.]